MSRITAGQSAAVRALVARRAELRLRQTDLAEEAVVSKRAIQDIETGKAWPRPGTREKIERALGWPIGHLADIAADIDQRPQGPNPYTGAEADLYEVLRGIDGMPEADRHMLVSVYRMHRTRGDETVAGAS